MRGGKASLQIPCEAKTSRQLSSSSAQYDHEDDEDGEDDAQYDDEEEEDNDKRWRSENDDRWMYGWYCMILSGILMKLNIVV